MSRCGSRCRLLLRPVPAISVSNPMDCLGAVGVEFLQHRGDLEGDSSVVGHRQVADAVHADVANREVGMVDPGVPTGHDQVVEVAVEGDEPGPAAGRRQCELGDEVGAWGELAHKGQQLTNPRKHGALMRRAERDEGVDPGVPALPLDVVAGDQTTQAVPDDMDLLVAGPVGEPLDRRGEVNRRRTDVPGEQAVVEGGQVAEPPPPKGSIQHSEDRVVVADSVHEKDGGGGEVDALVDQPTLLGGQTRQRVPAAAAAGRLGEQAERVHDHVGADPACLDDHPGCHPGQLAREAGDATDARDRHGARLVGNPDHAPRKRRSMARIARRGAEEERAEMFFLCE